MRSPAVCALSGAWLLVSQAAPASEPAPRETTPIDTTRIELRARLRFLTDRIETQRLHADIWWTGWTVFFASGLTAQSVRAAAFADTRAERADLIISAVKAGAAFFRKGFEVHGGLLGADEFAYLPERTTLELRAKVAMAEGVLAYNAEETDPWGVWYAHAINVALNATHAVIVGAAFDDWSSGLVSAAIGTTIGEISILTQPWEADSDLEEYEERFGGAVDRSETITVTLAPSPGGAALHVSF